MSSRPGASGPEFKGPITAPYNFVPLANEVFRPAWQNVSHDQPLVDGVCGTLHLSIQSHTPILPGESKNNRVVHYTLPDGHLAIPGSTLRGMIRNVVEIASFAAMRFIDDARFSVRDLNDQKLYRDRMQLGSIKAGWLAFSDGHWRIRPADYVRVKDTDIFKVLKINNWQKIVETGWPQAAQKYTHWLTKGGQKDLSVKFDIEETDKHGRLARNLTQGSVGGTLVFSGQPGPKKRVEFIFLDESDGATDHDGLVISDSVWRGFQDIYMDERKPNEHWMFLKSHYQHKPIPVFYQTKNNQVSSLGLAQMYKLPYEHTIYDLLPTDHDLAKQGFDLAELIFGVVDAREPIERDQDSRRNVKGRVSFSVAKSEKKINDVKTTRQKVVLNSPNPTYYPNYLEQPHKDGKLTDGSYRTYMDHTARIRGWKRYPVKPKSMIDVQMATAKQRKLASDIEPVESELTYTGCVRFHNLKPMELGALIWAIRLGGDPSRRHAIGMGKSFGYGQISIDIDKDKSDIVPNQINDAPPSVDTCQLAYEDAMEQAIPGWIDSAQIKSLLAMADPAMAPGQPGQLSHMDLAGGGRHNQFVIAKKNRLVLRPYIDLPDSSDSAQAIDSHSPAGQWLLEVVDRIANQTNANDKTVMLGRLLAREWASIEDLALKTAVLNEIQRYWKRNGGWEGHSGSRKKAFAIYTT